MKTVTNKKHFAFFLPSLRGGGAERVFINLAKGVLDKGFTVDLVLVQKEGPYLDKIDERLNVIDLKAEKVFFSFIPLVIYLRRERPDVLVSAMPHTNIVALMAKIASLSQVNVIATEHNPPSIAQKRVKFVKRFAIKVLVKVFYSRATAVVAVSQGVADDLVRTFRISKSNLHVIYNPMDIKHILESSKEELEHKWLKEKKHPVVLSVGRLTKQKDFATLISAFKKLKGNKNVRLIVLGEGEERENLEKLVRELGLQDYIDMPGFVDNPYAYMDKADLFVLSSIHEGLPTVLIEAMVCGTPVVSTNCPSGPAEILENGRYGKLVPVNDTDALAQAIEEALNNPVNSSQNLKEKANNFTSEKAVNKYLGLINGRMKQ